MVVARVRMVVVKVAVGWGAPPLAVVRASQLLATAYATEAVVQRCLVEEDAAGDDDIDINAAFSFRCRSPSEYARSSTQRA